MKFPVKAGKNGKSVYIYDTLDQDKYNDSSMTLLAHFIRPSKIMLYIVRMKL